MRSLAGGIRAGPFGMADSGATAAGADEPAKPKTAKQLKKEEKKKAKMDKFVEKKAKQAAEVAFAVS